MTEHEFFVLDRQRGADADVIFSATDRARYGDAPRCPQCGLFTGMRRWLPPHEVEVHYHGSDTPDVVFGFGGPDFLASPRFVDTFRERDLVGLDIRPVRICRRLGPHAGERSEPYLYASVRYGPAAIDPQRSAILRSLPETCTDCFSDHVVAVAGFHIDRRTWSGEHFFVPRGLPNTIVVHRDVVDMAQSVRLVGFVTTPTAAFRR